ncbi:TetR/AcrR family transcriptional regulator, tetracycline repressor protein [Nonomuraea solani]|uniref:TetR/AcrR family transcriptional regulator, tetracycline repressor protein n=1 Tax=Nonomuraea solani TaxID=1144553 RepID=A0A1H6E233_9ACTN|nr:TetR/AcrR family transcriptional regulator C-terminal domain-containing protein [Nonomuraea solani]SEG91617.1 TetR/AcrR family transcriptional regulator, tetracycline repressor protein [Nonomuraea solani]
MTKRQTLDPGTVVAAALRLLDDQGLEAVTTRAVAGLLGVRMNTVLWHVKTKAGLLELMADAIAAEISLQDLPASPPERVRELMRRYRRALTSHRDGAALVAGTYAAEPGTLRFADAVVAALMDGGATPREAAWTLNALAYFTLGLAQEEQGMPAGDASRLRDAVARGSYPALREALGHLTDATFDERFEDGLTRILA